MAKLNIMDINFIKAKMALVDECVEVAGDDSEDTRDIIEGIIMKAMRQGAELAN